MTDFHLRYFIMFNLVVINQDSADVEIKLLHPPTPLINWESEAVELKLPPKSTPLINQDKAERRGLEHLCRISNKKKKRKKRGY